MSLNARSVAVEAATRARWASAEQPFELGLLLGQRHRGGDGGVDSVLAAAPVPPETESGVAGGFEDVSPEWVRDCAQQVDRMLPGGVAILGLYVRAAALPAAAAFDKAAFYLRELVTRSADASTPTELYVAHVSGAEAPAFQIFLDVGDAAKTTTVAAELVDVPGGVKLTRYHTLIGVSEVVLFSASAVSAEARAAEVVAALEPLMDRVRRGVCVPVEEEQDSQLMKLLAPAPQAPTTAAADAKSLFGSVKGTIHAVAYVCSTEDDPVKAATEYLKSDVLKTLRLRIDLARERWSDDADESGQSAFEVTGRVLLPKRNAITWHRYSPSSAPGLFDLSFYAFPDDDVAQAAENAFEMLGGLAAKPQKGASTKALEGSWAIVEQDERGRNEKILAARKDDPEFAPMPYHYVLICIPVALALVFLLVLNSISVQRDLMGYDDDE